MLKRGVTHEEMEQYVQYYTDRKVNRLLMVIDSLETKMKAIAEANAEMIRENAIRIKSKVEK